MSVHNGDMRYRFCSGMADLENQVAASLATNYRLASVTKQMTAMAIAILQNSGALSSEASLRTFFPGFPAFADGICIRHLLNHQSGLLDYEELLEGFTPSSGSGLRDDDVIKILQKTSKVHFTPGTQYRYSNGGYCILAEIARLVSGMSFADFLQKEIFTPLKMTHTVAFEEGISTVAHRAYGYTKLTDGTFLRTDQNITSSTLGDGGVYSSLEDLFKWDQALNDASLVPRSFLDSIFQPAHLDDGQISAYSWGWMFGTHLNRRCIYHTGGTIGFRTILRRYENPQFTVIVLMNSSEDGLVQAIADKVAEVCLEQNL